MKGNLAEQIEDACRQQTIEECLEESVGGSWEDNLAKAAMHRREVITKIMRSNN